jgi:hypothetical protein
MGLRKYPGSEAGKRGSSPKLRAINTALITSAGKHSHSTAQADKEFWGGWWNPWSGRIWSKRWRGSAARSSIGASAIEKSSWRYLRQ